MFDSLSIDSTLQTPDSRRHMIPESRAPYLYINHLLSQPKAFGPVNFVLVVHAEPRIVCGASARMRSLGSNAEPQRECGALDRMQALRSNAESRVECGASDRMQALRSGLCIRPQCSDIATFVSKLRARAKDGPPFPRGNWHNVPGCLSCAACAA